MPRSKVTYDDDDLESLLSVGSDQPLEKDKDDSVGQEDYHGIDTRARSMGADDVYNKKSSILNEALIDIGMGSFQWKIFALTGFGWFMDALWMHTITLIIPRVQAEFNIDRIGILPSAICVGLVTGAGIWSITADSIGRRLAFNITLLISSVAGISAAASPNVATLVVLCITLGFGVGGNTPVDSTIFMEFIPATHQGLLMAQAAFWSVGAVVATLVAWPWIANYSCPPDTPAGQCEYQDNRGWRYTLLAIGGLAMTMFILRLLLWVPETPKFLLSMGRDQEAVDVVANIAHRNGKQTWLAISDFEAVDEKAAPSDRSMTPAKRKSEKWAVKKVQALFSTSKLAQSMILLMLLWSCVGLAAPFYNAFLPFFIERKGLAYGATSISDTYGSIALQSLFGIPSAILSRYVVEMKRVGRKGTGTLACLTTGICLSLFTLSNTKASVLAFICAINFCQMPVYGILYSYTTELFPAPIRGTALGLVAIVYRFCNLTSPVIVTFIGIDSNLPIWLSAALFSAGGVVFLLLPYELRGIAAC